MVAEQLMGLLWRRHFHCGSAFRVSPCRLSFRSCSDVASCSLCQNYLQELARVAPPQQFDSANVRVSVVGHGEASVIKGVSGHECGAYMPSRAGCRLLTTAVPRCSVQYTDFLKLPWTVYAQPSKELHKALGMVCSLNHKLGCAHWLSNHSWLVAPANTN